MLVIVLLATFGGARTGRAQPASAAPIGWNVRLLAGAGVPSSLGFVERQTDGLALVSTLRLGYGGRLRGPLVYNLGVESLVAQRRGRLDEVKEYKVRTARVGVEGLVGLSLPATRLSAAAGLQVRNQSDVGDLELRRRDNLRIDLRLAADYPLVDRLHATAVLARDLRHRDDSHYLADPRHQVLVGVRYALRKRQQQ